MAYANWHVILKERDGRLLTSRRSGRSLPRNDRQSRGVERENRPHQHNQRYRRRPESCTRGCVLRRQWRRSDSLEPLFRTVIMGYESMPPFPNHERAIDIVAVHGGEVEERFQ